MEQAAVSGGFDAFVCNESVCFTLVNEDYMENYKKVYDFLQAPPKEDLVLAD